MNRKKEDLILRNRFLELAHTADKQGICTFSNFLNLDEQNTFFNLKHELPKIKYFSFGGYESAERKMLCFCQDFQVESNDEINYPITIVKIQPINHKFSDDLTHRDFLGAVLNLGIDRNTTGDILIKDNIGYVFALDTIGQFISDHLSQVKNTMVETSLLKHKDFAYKPSFKEKKGSVSSVRLDSILSVALNLSRSKASDIIKAGKVFINSRVTLSNSQGLEEGDLISVRGIGKFMYLGIIGKSKKDRYIIKINIYQ